MSNFDPDEFIRKYGSLATEEDEELDSPISPISEPQPIEEEPVEPEPVAESVSGFDPDEFIRKYGGEPKQQVEKSEDFLARQAQYLMSRPPLDEEIMAEPEPEGDGLLRQALDIPINIKVGAVRGVKFMTDIFGADNPVSNALKSYEGIFTDLLSAESQQDQETIARIMQEAEDEGILGQIAAGLQAFTVAPLDMTAQAAGTMIPILAAGLVGKVAKLGATGVRALQAGAGGGMGVGVVKSEIYEGVYEYMLSKGVDEEEARRTASQAQAYNGKNLDSILIGGGLGIVAASTGAERIVSAIMMKAGGRPTGNLVQRVFKAGFTEAAPESAQGFQEKLAQNLALQREGADVDLGRGVFANAALEGAAGFTVGGPLGVFKAPMTPQEVAGLAKETQQAANQAKDVAPATSDTVEKLADTISVDATVGPLARTEGETDEQYRARMDILATETPDEKVARLQREAQEAAGEIELEEEVPVSGLPPQPVTPTPEAPPVAPVSPVEPVVAAEGAVEPAVTEVAPEVKNVRQFKLADVEPPTNLEGWRALRNERIAAERQLLQEEIGLTPEQAETLHDLYIVRNSDNTERWVKRNLSPEQVSKFEAFDEGQFNQRGGPVEFLEYDSDFNPEFLDVENDAPSLANAIVQAFTKGKPEQGLNDKWIYSVGAIQKLEAIGGSRQDISDALTQQARRVAGSEGDAEFWYRERGREINETIEAFAPNLPTERGAAPAAVAPTPELAAPVTPTPVTPTPVTPEAPTGPERVFYHAGPTTLTVDKVTFDKGAMGFHAGAKTQAEWVAKDKKKSNVSEFYVRDFSEDEQLDTSRINRDMSWEHADALLVEMVSEGLLDKGEAVQLAESWRDMEGNHKSALMSDLKGAEFEKEYVGTDGNVGEFMLQSSTYRNREKLQQIRNLLVEAGVGAIEYVNEVEGVGGDSRAVAVFDKRMLAPATEAPTVTPTPEPPALAPLRRVVKAEQTEEDVSGLVGQGLVELYNGQPVITQAGLETLPEAERPRLTPEARKIQIDTRTSEAAAEAISKNLRIGVDQVPFDVRMPAGWTVVGDIYVPPTPMPKISGFDVLSDYEMDQSADVFASLYGKRPPVDTEKILADARASRARKPVVTSVDSLKPKNFLDISLKEALKKASRMNFAKGSRDEMFADIAAILAESPIPALRDEDIVSLSSRGRRGRAVRFWGGDIGMASTKGMSIGVLLHEGGHSLTADQLRKYGPKIKGSRPINGKEYIDQLKSLSEDQNIPEPVRRIFSLYVSTIEQLGLMDVYAAPRGLAGTPSPDTSKRRALEMQREGKIPKDFTGSDFYGLANIYEFVSQTFNSKSFQDKLKNIKSPINANKTLWQEFVTAIRDILGFPSDSMAAAVIEAAVDISMTVPSVRMATFLESQDTLQSFQDAIELKNYLEANKTKDLAEAKDAFKNKFNREPHQFAGQHAKFFSKENIESEIQKYQSRIDSYKQQFTPSEMESREGLAEEGEPAPTFTEESPEAKTLSNLKASMEKVDGASESKGGKPETQKVSEIAANWMESGGDERALQDAITENTNLSPANAAKVARVIAKQYDIQQQISQVPSAAAIPETITPTPEDRRRPKTTIQRVLDAITGVRVPPVKLLVNEKTALKDQIKLKAAAYRDAKGAQKETAASVVEAIKEMDIRGGIRPKQASALMKRAAMVNFASEKSVDNFITYAEKVVENANYDRDVADAKAAQKRAKEIAKRKNVGAPQKQVLEDIGKVEVKYLNDPREFAEAANYYMRAFKSPVSESYLVVPDEEMNAYLGRKQEETQEGIKASDQGARERLAEKYGVPLDEVDAVMDAEDTQAALVQYAKREGMIGLINEKARDSIAALQIYNTAGMTVTQQELVAKILDLDVDGISLESRVQLIRNIDNILVNGQTNGVQKFVSAAEGQSNAFKASKNKTFTNQQRAWINILFGQTIGKKTRGVGAEDQKQIALGIQSIADTFRNIFGKKNLGLITQIMGFGDLLRGTKAFHTTMREITEETSKFFDGLTKRYSYKIISNNEGRTAEGVASYLIQQFPLKTEEESIATRRGVIAEDLNQKIRSGDSEATAEAELVSTILEKIDGNTTEEILANLKREFPANYEALMWYKNELLPKYKDFLKQFDENFNNQANNYNNPNYLPMGYAFAKAAELSPEAQRKIYNKTSLTQKQAANSIKRQDYDTLPKNQNGLPAAINYNLRTNVFNSLSDQLKKAYTSDGWTKVQAFVNSKDAIEVFGNEANREFIARRLELLQDSQDRRGYENDGFSRVLDGVAIFLRRLGIGIGLGGVGQVIKQAPDQIATTIANTGDVQLTMSNFYTMAFTTKERADAMKLMSGFSIAERGDAVVGGAEFSNPLESGFSNTEKFLRGGDWARIKDAARNISDVWLIALKKSDFWAASSGWLTYYQKKLEEEGGTFTNFAEEAELIKTDPMRQRAAYHAELMIDIYQGSSDPTRMARLSQRGKTGYENAWKGIFLAFNSFVLQQRTRMHSDLGDAMSKQVDPENKKLAKMGLSGTIAGILVFHMMRRYALPAISGMGAYAVYTMLGVDPEEPDEEKKKADAAFQLKRFYSEVAGNVLVGGFGSAVEQQTITALNQGAYILSRVINDEWIMDDEGEVMEFDKWKRDRAPFWYYESFKGGTDLGVFGIGFDQLANAQEALRKATDPELRDTLTTEEQRVLSLAAFSEILFLARLNDSDVARMFSRMGRETIAEAKERDAMIRRIQTGR